MGTLVWVQAAAQTIGISLSFGGMGCRHQHSPWLYQDHCLSHGLQQLHRLLHSLHMTSGSYTKHSHHLSALREQSPRTSPRHHTVTDCMHPHGSQVSSWSGAAAWTTNTNMASGGITGHGSPSRRSNPEREPFLILASIVAQSQGHPTAMWQVWG